MQIASVLCGIVLSIVVCPGSAYFPTLSHKDSLWIKPRGALNSNFIGIITLHVSGSLSAHHQEFLDIHRFWYILWSCDRLLPGVGWDCQHFHPTPGRKRSSQLHIMYQSRYMAKNSWWWAERLPETCRVVISIKLECSASVGFIHKESVTMHGHTSVKKSHKGNNFRKTSYQT